MDQEIIYGIITLLILVGHIEIKIGKLKIKQCGIIYKIISAMI